LSKHRVRLLSLIHPFLFASSSVLSLMAVNRAESGLLFMRAWIFSMAGVVVVLILAWLWLGDLGRAGLLTSLSLILISSFGHLSNVLQGRLALPPGAVQAGLLLAGGIAWLAWARWLRRGSPPVPRLAAYFFWVALLMNLFPGASLLSFAQQRRNVRPRLEAYVASLPQRAGLDGLLQSWPDPEAPGPDVYLIVLDAYARHDILQELYGLDNSPFLAALEGMGFKVVEGSRANYPDTSLSMASTLNMAHLVDLGSALDPADGVVEKSLIMEAARQLVDRNALMAFFKARGYRVVGYDGGYGEANTALNDAFIQPPGLQDADSMQVALEVMLLDTTIGRLLMPYLERQNSPLEQLFEAHRQRILFTLTHLPEAARGQEPIFVYAHIVAPHVPFVFGPQGEPLAVEDPFTLMDAHPGDPQNVQRYADQVRFVSSRILVAVEQILAASDRPPVIVIMGDHGGKVFGGPEPSPQERARLLYPNLLALYLPGVEAAPVPENLTLVNVFRLVLNLYFGADLEMLPDISYAWQAVPGGVRLVEACQVYGHCP